MASPKVQPRANTGEIDFRLTGLLRIGDAEPFREAVVPRAPPVKPKRSLER
jgi:hypothetical protein